MAIGKWVATQINLMLENSLKTEGGGASLDDRMDSRGLLREAIALEEIQRTDAEFISKPLYVEADAQRPAMAGRARQDDDGNVLVQLDTAEWLRVNHLITKLGARETLVAGGLSKL